MLPLPLLTSTSTLPIGLPNGSGVLSPTVRGVPTLDPDYVLLPNGCYDVVEWYGRHPYHPAKPLLVPGSPLPLVNAADYGDNLQRAVDALPATGGTIYCPAGEYSRAAIVGKSNVHFYGEAGTIFRGVNIFSGAACENYPAFNRLIDDADPAAVKLLLDPVHNFYFNGITFDASGYISTMVDDGTPDWVCLGLYCVRDVLLDNCTFQNLGYQPAFHTALITGNRGLANIWARNCAFHGNSSSGTTSAVFLDGPRGCGFLACTIDGYFGSQAFQFQCNDDFSIDLNGNGTVDLDERREARYVVLDGVASTADCHSFAGFQGFSNLVQGCSQTVHVGAFVFLVSRCGSRDGCAYTFTGNIVQNNVVDNADYYVTVDGSNVYGSGCRGGSTLGKYTVRNNRQTKFRANAVVLETQPVVGPSVVSGNVRPDGTPADHVAQQLVERWADLSNWTSTASGKDAFTPQNGKLQAVCQSAALLSKSVWDSSEPLVASCAIQARPAGGSSSSSFWAGLAFTDPTTSDDLYAEIELTGQYPPGATDAAGIRTSNTFTTPPGADDRVAGPYTAWEAHTLGLQWYPDVGQIYYMVDGAQKQLVKCSISGPLKVQLVVASVLPSTPDDGSSAEALVGPLTIQGVPAG